MARVPTWTELRLDATKLFQIQEQCYRSVHHLLDHAIPELDSKLNKLTHNTDKRKQNVRFQNSGDNPDLNQSRFRPSPRRELMIQPEYHHVNNTTLAPTTTSDQAHFRLDLDSNKICSALKKAHTDAVIVEKRRPTQTVKVGLVPHKLRHKKAPIVMKEETPIDQLEHLKPLPMPLSEYFKMNRPNLVDRADKRVMYIRKSAEKRKSLKVTSGLEHMKLTSKNTLRNNNNNNNLNGYRALVRPSLKECMALENADKYKITEQEMKKLTAKHYKRLPEVKKRKREEVTNHLKAQNYKNKLEYGRKLQENRRKGIINYPLRNADYYDDRSVTSSQYDDRSLTTISSQEDSIVSGIERSIDPYY